MSAVTDQLTDYYLDRLILQYKNKKNARATVALVTPVQLADGIAFDVRDAYNLDTAQGKQLDVLGKYVGLPRNIAPVAPKPFFQMGSYSQATPTDYPYGFTSYNRTTGNYTGIWASYKNFGTQTTDLPDNLYSLMIRLKIYDNAMNGTLKGIVDYLWAFFTYDIQVQDNKNMTLTYFVDNNFGVSDATLLNYLPRPMGVGINIVRKNLRLPYTLIYSSGLPVTLSDGTNILLEL